MVRFSPGLIALPSMKLFSARLSCSLNSISPPILTAPSDVAQLACPAGIPAIVCLGVRVTFHHPIIASFTLLAYCKKRLKLYYYQNYW